MSKFVMLAAVLVAMVYLTEAIAVPNDMFPNNMYDQLNANGFSNGRPNFDAVRAMRPEDGGQMSSMAFSSSSSSDKSGTVHHGGYIVNENGKITEGSYKK